MSDPPGKPNRLATEKSPYLLQHAQNPVDWYPWGDEALKRAETEDKPIFLSIGYSTCHWCHVMENESFEDAEVANLLNKEFVSVKVDREERPDIDSVYMKACMLMTGSGGWPLTIILTPEKQPFFAGTYIPKKSRGERLGLLDLLTNVAELWKNDRDKLITTADKVTGYLIEYQKTRRGTEELTEILLDEAFIKLLDGFDRVNAGFGTSPKFPSPHNLLFLLRYWKRKGVRQALEMVEKTLQKMRLGGIFDQVGFGFHRYSTDSAWLVPHFEKMLYDQAMLLITYIEAYQATGNNEYLQTAEELIEYILRELTDTKGGFFSAEDADSEGQEGKFYLWTEPEIKLALGEDANLILRVFNISEKGNFADPIHRGETGTNVLHLKKPLHDLSSELGMKREELTRTVKKARQRLFTVREKRIHPLKDDKILTGWNGLMIAAMAKGAQIFASQRYVKIAEKAAEFILENLQDADGRLVHRYRAGEARIDGYLEDYAFLVWGLIELYEATFKIKYLAEAMRRQEEMIAHFWDEEHDGFFFTSDDSEKILIRGKEFHDGAYPSGNSVALLNLVRLARITGNVHYEEKAARLANAFVTREADTSSPNTMFLTGLDFVIGPASEIVIVGDPASRETKEMINAIRTGFLPNKVVLFKEENDSDLTKLASFTEEMKTIDRKTTAYVCQNFICNKPITDLKEVLETLGLRDI